MKKNLLLLLLAVAIFFPSTAQTDVSGIISNNITWTSAGSPYTVTGNITVNSGVTLTIESGTVVQFNSNTQILVHGTLNANGVTFTANSSTQPGFWDGIYVGNHYNLNYGSVTLNNCSVEYAKSLSVRKGTLTLTNNTVLNNFSSYGVDIYLSGSLNIDHTSIQNCDYPVYFRESGSWDVGEGVVLTGNAHDYVFLAFNKIDASFSCMDVGIPYYYTRSITVSETGTWLISHGVELYGSNDAGIYVNGKIKVSGTEQDTVLFTKAPSGNWTGISINDNAVDSACVFNYCKISSVSSAHYGMKINESSPELNNCKFSDNDYNLYVTGRSFPVFNECDFKESVVAQTKVKNIRMYANAEPVFNNCNIAFNDQEGRGIGIVASTVYDDAHLKKISFNGLENITFLILGNIVIQDTASLTIDPGIVIKANRNIIYANGALTCTGTEVDPIIITQYDDDDFGNPGDSFNDGASTVYKSTGCRFKLTGSATSRLEYCNILYGGYGNTDYAVEINNSNVLKNCDIKHSYKAVLFSDDAQILNNEFEDIENFALTRRMNSGAPVLIGNTVSNVGNNGICVHSFDAGDYEIGSLSFAGISNAAYFLNEWVTIPDNANVTILPGTVFKSSNGGMKINGGLKAEGTKNNKIIFTSVYDNSVSGNTNNNNGEDPVSHKWGGMAFNNSSNDAFNSLKNVEVRYFNNSITFTDCNAVVDSVALNFSGSYGMVFLGDAAPVISNCEFNNIDNAPIKMDLLANPSFSGNSMANVKKAGISINGGTVSGTVPVRSFAGYENITYLIEAPLRVNDELVIPAGIVFKGNSYASYFDIYGKLTVQGTESDPVIFTALNDDGYGNPNDTEQNGSGTVNKKGCGIIFRESADDASVIDHAVFRYTYYFPVNMTNASPTISNSLFYDPSSTGMALNGKSYPVITGCTFEDNTFPMQIELTSYPVSTSGNVLVGSTGIGFWVKDNGTLTEDITLEKRDFAGITGIPYIFGNYTVGTSAVLTIKPGVILKFKDNSYLNVRKGLIAEGGSSSDSVIVFTSVNDDFYGGDTYGDGDDYLPSEYSWGGIRFPDESIDASCILEHCIIKNASRHYSDAVSSNNFGAVTINNSSPSIHNCLFKDDYWGVLVRNTSAPDIGNCDFTGQDNTSGYGIWNETGMTEVVAENCWWNHITGPYNQSLNPDGEGERVSDHVDFDPWLTEPLQPVLGDVSLNGIVKPYDASLILQSVVGSINLTTKQQSVADVSFNGDITSYDASLILQYSVGLIAGFAPGQGGKAMMKSTVEPDVSVSVPFTYLEPEELKFEIPVSLTTSKDVKSVDMQISSVPGHVRFIEVNSAEFASDIMIASGYDEESGTVKVSMASANDLNLNGENVTLVFEFTGSGQQQSDISLESLVANETCEPDENFTVSVGSNKIATAIDKNKVLSGLKVYSFGSLCKADLSLAHDQSKLIISVYDVTGQMTNQVVYSNVRAGQNHFTFRPESKAVQYAKMYIVIVKGDDFTVTRKLVVK